MQSSSRNFWNHRFAADSYVFGTEPSVFLQENVQYIPTNARVLMPGDGEGRNSIFLAKLGCSVVATDIAEEGIAKAQKLARSAGVTAEFLHVDLQGWQWPTETFDAVVAIFIQFAPPEFRDEIFAGMKQAVRPGGLVFLHGYTPKQLEYRTGGPPSRDHLYTHELLHNAFADWEIVRLETYERTLDEGAGHRGQSALIDLIARRP